MNPGYARDITSYTPGRTFIDLAWVSGATGAVPSTFIDRAGVYSVTRTNTGAYDIVLEERPYRFSNLLSGTVQQASYSKTGACAVRLVGVDLANRKVQILVVDGDGDAVDPTTNDIVRLTLDCRIKEM